MVFRVNCERVGFRPLALQDFDFIIERIPFRNSVFAGNVLGFIDLNSNKETMLDSPGPCHFVCFDSAGRYVAAATGRNILVYETRDGKLISELATNGSISSIEFGLKEGTLIVCVNGVQVWNIDSGTRARWLLGHEQIVNKSASLTSANGQIITASRDAKFKTWNFNAPKNPRQTHLHDGPVRDIANSTDGKWFASASEDGNVAVFSKSGSINFILPHPCPVLAV